MTRFEPLVTAVRREIRWELHALGLAAKRFFSGDHLTFASSIAYYALVSMFPFLLLAFAVLGAVTASAEDRNVVVGFLLESFPRQFSFLTSQLDAIRSSPLSLGIIGAAGLVWASLGVFGAISSAIDRVWNVEHPRGFVAHRLVSFAMLIAAALLMALVVLLISARSLFEASWFVDRLRDTPGVSTMAGILTGFVTRFATMLMVIGVVAMVLYFVPNTTVRLRDVLPGAVLTGLLWRLSLEGFTWYTRDIARLTAIHGSIAGVVVFMFWIYLSAVVFLYGAEFTVAYGGLRRAHPRPRAHPPPPAPDADDESDQSALG